MLRMMCVEVCEKAKVCRTLKIPVPACIEVCSSRFCDSSDVNTFACLVAFE